MKFKRCINLKLAKDQSAKIPTDELWKVTIADGSSGMEGAITINGAYSGQHRTSVLLGGTELKSDADMAITGVAFTAD